MAPLPPKGDPQRPLRLASRSTLVLGILFVALGSCGTLSMFFVRAGVRGGGGGVPASTAIMAALSGILFYFGPGALYIVCSVFLKRRRLWAAIAAMVLAGIHLLFVVIGLVAMLAMAPWDDDPIIWVPIGVLVIFIIALAQLEYHLARSFEAIRQPLLEQQRGFEPLPAMPVMPAANDGSGDGASASH